MIHKLLNEILTRKARRLVALMLLCVVGCCNAQYVRQEQNTGPVKISQLPRLDKIPGNAIIPFTYTDTIYFSGTKQHGFSVKDIQTKFITYADNKTALPFVEARNYTPQGALIGIDTIYTSRTIK